MVSSSRAQEMSIISRRQAARLHYAIAARPIQKRLARTERWIMASIDAARPIPWWREPTKDQWLAWVAAWLGWTLDSFHFTIFLLIMLPIAKDFGVPLTDVTFVFTITLWMRLIGAVSSGWLGDRVGRRLPLMISILGYSLCNFIAGFSPAFWFLFLFRALLGFFMGAEWPAPRRPAILPPYRYRAARGRRRGTQRSG
jgi:sugar phosphate permease